MCFLMQDKLNIFYIVDNSIHGAYGHGVRLCLIEKEEAKKIKKEETRINGHNLWDDSSKVISFVGRK